MPILGKKITKYKYKFRQGSCIKCHEVREDCLNIESFIINGKKRKGSICSACLLIDVRDFRKQEHRKKKVEKEKQNRRKRELRSIVWKIRTKQM